MAADDSPKDARQEHGALKRLPWGCYLLRGALSPSAQVALAQRVGELATGAFSDRGGWAGIAATQEHPIIVASHSAAATRPRGEQNYRIAPDFLPLTQAPIASR